MPVNSLSEANGAMNDFFYAVKPKLDERLEKLLADAKNSPIIPEGIATTAEAVYANHALFTTEELAPIADLADFGGAMMFITLRDMRGNKIGSFLRGDQVEDMPEPDPRYLPPPETVEEPPVPPLPEAPGE